MKTNEALLPRILAIDSESIISKSFSFGFSASHSSHHHEHPAHS